MGCKSSPSCEINGCYSAFKTFLHCKGCRASDCSVCFLVKGKKNGSDPTDKTVEWDLDVKCGVYFDGKSSFSKDGSQNRRVTVETQTDGIVSDDSFSKKVTNLINHFYTLFFFFLFFLHLK